MEKIITSKVRQNLNEHTARIILERSDKLASSTLEQLRKSTDRAYTIMGFLLTVFVALTAYVASMPPLALLSIAITMWIGIGIATYIMFSKVIWVHSFRHTGNDPRNMIQEANIDVLAKKYDFAKLNERYSLHTLLDAISINQSIIDRNREILEQRCNHIETAMTVIKCSIMLSTLITVVSLLVSIFLTW